MSLPSSPSGARMLPRLVLLLAFFVPFNLAAAAVVTYLLHMGDGYLQNLVFSCCICGLAYTLIAGGRRLLWPTGRPPAPAYLLLIVFAVGAAYVLGSALAVAMLHLSAPDVIDYQLRNFVPLVIFTLLASGFAVWFLTNRVRIAELAARAEAEKARAAAVERQAMQTQLQLLQAQIEPHMLFNTLANLQGLIAADPARAQHMLDQLIVYLRATLSSSRAPRTTLAAEFELTRAYLELMSVRLGKRLAYRLDLPATLKETAVPPMLLQPLVENAIKHGIEPKIEGGEIEVAARKSGNAIELAVKDTGLGLAPNAFAAAFTDTDPHSTHIGLANVRERLHALYGDAAGLSLSPNTPSGALASITLPS